MSSTSEHKFSAAERHALLDLASTAIQQGLAGNTSRGRLKHHRGRLAEQSACFVTLNYGRQLRGCMGTLEAFQPLALDVTDNAYSAAFRDPRFSPLTADEFSRIGIHISVLTPASSVTFKSEQDLIEQLQPRVDGLILSLGDQRGTFLPAVWESLPDPRDFLQHLKRKAGLPADFWSDDIRIDRYHTISISRQSISC